ncbi:hypothetical protein HN51_022176, partial [Arachis hypogaea]
LLPARFTVRAFPRKLDFLNVIQLTGPSIRMKFRWRDIRPNEVFLTKGWRKFCRNHKLWKVASCILVCHPLTRLR